MMELFSCRLCGGDLKIDSGDTYKCSCCGSVFVKKAEEDFGEKLKGVLGEEKFARVSAARQNLWAAMHEEYVNSSSCLEYARELKSLVPSDYYANFAETANGKGEEEISKFLNRSSKKDMETYADAVLDFMIKSMTPGDLTAVCNYIDRAFHKASPEYAKYINLYEEEAEKVESGIYELTMPRDVFVAYSSKDIDKVLELTDYLEEQGISCFISMRNLRHGRGAADNYDRALQTAIDNCKTVVFISSKNSRSLACDALRKEIPYIRKTDTDIAPAEYRSLAYEKIPYRYKKDRVEYLLDDYANTAADKIVKQFFDGVEWCKTPDDVADRVITYLTAVPETDDAPRSGNIGDDDIQKIISAVSGADKTLPSEVSGVASSVAMKERNVVGQVERLLAMGDFAEAKDRLDDLEKEERSQLGICSAAVYYYRILAENEVDGDKKLTDKLVAVRADLKNNRNFRLAQSCEDGPEKTKLLELEKKVEKTIAENERKAREEQRKREEKERLERKKREEAERKERERREEEERIENERREAALKEQNERWEAQRKAERERLEAEKRKKKEEEAAFAYAATHWSKGNSIWKWHASFVAITRTLPVLFILCAVLVLVASLTMSRLAGSDVPHYYTYTLRDDYQWMISLSIVNMVIAGIVSLLCIIYAGRKMGMITVFALTGIISIICLGTMLICGIVVYADINATYSASPVDIHAGSAPVCITAVSAAYIVAALALMFISFGLKKKSSVYAQAAEYAETRHDKTDWHYDENGKPVFID